MRITIIIFFIFHGMYGQDQIESFLNCNISKIESFINSEVKENVSSYHNKTNKFYSNKQFLKKYFFGIEYNVITFQINDDGLVVSISLHLNALISSNAIKEIEKIYGEPSEILIKENTKLISETESTNITHEFNQNIKKSIFNLRSGTFKEKPLFIKWHKSNYRIEAIQLYKQKKSKITFEL